MPLPINIPNIVQRSSKDIVYTNLKQWIIDGTLLPGEKIIDSEIASLFSVSRTPVREAILNLESQNLVEITPGKGTIVSHFNMDKIKKLYEALVYIHISVMDIAFGKIDDSTINKLIGINERFLQHIKSNNIEQIISTDIEFHQVFFTLANNDYLNSFHEQLITHTNRVENIYFQSTSKGEGSYNAHNNIINYIKERNLEKVKEELTLNWLNTIDLKIVN